VSQAVTLEQSYQRWLRCYPKAFRQEHGAEILAVLMDSADASERPPTLVDRLDLLRSALWLRLRPRIPRSDRSMCAAIKLMWIGAIVELAVAITVFGTTGDVRSSIISRNPGLTQAQWHAEVTGQLDHLIVAASIAVGFWLLMALANGRRQRWARVAFALFFGLNTYSLLTGLAAGSATYARADLVAGTVLWLVELTALVLIFDKELRRLAVLRKIAISRHVGT
jgi:hypothetical protein